MIQTKNFNPDTDPKLLCTCGHDGCDRRSVNQSTLNNVQLIRDDAGRPLTITSAGRCPNHPDELTRSVPADHQKCVGVDVFYSSDRELTELLVLAGRHGATAVAHSKNFVHMAWRVVPDNRLRSWEYK